MDLKQTVNDLIAREQFKLPQAEKEGALLPVLAQQVKENAAFSPQLEKFYTTLGKEPSAYASIADIPPIPVSMFKKFALKTCPDDQVSRVLNSSATTSGIPSRIYINKETALRQSKGLVAILKDFIGGARRPVLAIDTEGVNKGDADTLSARGAAIRGISNFGKKLVYVMDEKDGELFLNRERLENFMAEFKGQEILVSGFTYIIWTRFLKQVQDAGLKLDFPAMKLVHSGGWKKLSAQAVTKDKFSKALASAFNTKQENIIDFYGMVEQLGVIFLDCEAGHKHAPDFAEVIIRDPYTMKEQPHGKPGLIEIASIIPSSYPGQAIITEDVGETVGVDDCPCGRKGKYFVFRSRVERAETRGCGDTFAERRKDE
ncbi:MAG: acyl-protein synthetase [Candidatus Lokiarchaeota archaeon]|nr:acyl-protein synthetase [Candidatus Lokiarchaeota archaeon]